MTMIRKLKAFLSMKKKLRLYDIFSEDILKTSGAEDLLTKEQAIVLATSFADFIANPN